MTQKLIHDFVTLFVVLDPVGMLAIFIAVTADLKSAVRRKAAILGVLYSFSVFDSSSSLRGSCCSSRWGFRCGRFR